MPRVRFVPNAWSPEPAHVPDPFVRRDKTHQNDRAQKNAEQDGLLPILDQLPPRLDFQTRQSVVRVFIRGQCDLPQQITLNVEGIGQGS